MKQLFKKKSVSQILHDLKQIEENNEGGLKKNLHLRDLISFGIAAIVGAGIFSTIGNASFHGGPAVVFLFIFTAIACLFSALCYAEFASTVPISGSAYTYAYTTFGELVAWILGWALVMEYAIGNVVVAISWSGYFTTLLEGFKIHIPEYLTIDYRSAYAGFVEAQKAISENKELVPSLKEAMTAWNNAPDLGGFKLIFDLPAICITILMTMLVFVGIKESKRAGNMMVIFKLAVIFLVILVGIFYITPQNWVPFAPNGFSGVMMGVSSVFFAYIGFDAISTTAEECKNPQKDLPKAMILTLILCTILYIILALVLTGMVNYTLLQVDDPLAFVFQAIQLDFMAGLLAVSAVIAVTSVFLVYQLGQPRILMSMSRDGLLPKKFAEIHPRFKTPYFSTIFTGLLVAIPTLFLRQTEVLDLTSLGTLFAFAMVSGGVLLLETIPHNPQEKNPRFRVPYINGQLIAPFLLVLTLSLVFYYNYSGAMAFFTFQDTGEGFLGSFYHRIPLWFFVILAVSLSILSFLKKLSLIPVLGVLTNFYLMTELGTSNWIGFGFWMVLGLMIYFGYGYHHSKLKNRK